MRGSVKKQGKDSWRITISLGKDINTGRYLKYQETVKGLKKDAEKRLAELLVEHEKGININPEKITYSEYLDKWIKDYAVPNLAPRTLESYISIIEKHLKPNLGPIILAKLTPTDIQDFYTRALSGGRKDNKKTKSKDLSPTTVKHFHRLIHLTLSKALKKGLVSRNVAEAVDPPKTGSGTSKVDDVKFLTEDEIHKILEAVKVTYLYIPTLIGVYTGMRLGEVLGLCWKNIDFENNIIRLNQTLQYIDKQIIFRQPKTKGSKRAIYMANILKDELIKHQKDQEKNKQDFGEIYQNNDLVCTMNDGSPIKPCTISNQFVKVVKKLGINAHFHLLRHSHASLLLKENVQPKVVSEILGHSKIGITMDLYSHIMPGMQREASAKIEKLLASKKD